MRSLAPLLAASLLVPHAGAAQEVVLGIGSGLDYDSNVFASERDEIDDFRWQVQPLLRVEERTGDLSWGLRYEPSWESYLQDEAPSGWNHVVRADAEWQIDDATSVEVSDFFSRTSSVSGFNELDEEGVSPELELGRQRYKFNTFSAGVTRSLSPRSSLQLNARHYLRDYSDEAQRNLDTLGGSLGYYYVLTEADTVGASLGYTRQTFEKISNIDETSTDFYNLSGILRHRFSPTTLLNLSVGPAWVDSEKQDEPESAIVPVLATLTPSGRPILVNDRGALRFVDADTCQRLPNGMRFIPGPAGGAPISAEVSGCRPQGSATFFTLQSVPVTGAPSVDDSNITFFADTSLVKTWERWSLSVGYRREASTSTGFGTDSIVDTVRADARWTPSSRWTVSFLADWSRQSQASDQRVLVTTVENRPVLSAQLAFPTGVRVETVDDELRYDYYIGQVVANYRLTRTVSLSGTLRYAKQQQEVGGISSDFDRYGVGFLVTYEFDPIHL